MRDVIAHTPVLKRSFLLAELWALFTLGLYLGERGAEERDAHPDWVRLDYSGFFASLWGNSGYHYGLFHASTAAVKGTADALIEHMEQLKAGKTGVSKTGKVVTK